MEPSIEDDLEVVYHGNMRIIEFIRNLMIVAVMSLSSGPLFAAELLMIEQPDCPYCEKFHAEIGPAYPNTDEGRQAPLRILMLGDPYPNALKELKPASVTPTFILIDDNKEIDRLVGYPGDDYFWFLLGEMLSKCQP